MGRDMALDLDGYPQEMIDALALLPWPGWISANDMQQRNLWFGRCPSSTIHYDLLDNLAYVFEGKKTYELYPPDQFDNLYCEPPTPENIKNKRLHWSRVTTRVDPDLNEFPKFAEAEKHRIVIEAEAGDMLFIPGGWWHEVFTPDQTVMLNYWFEPAQDLMTI